MSVEIDWGGSLEDLARELEVLPDRLMNEVIDPVMDRETAHAEQVMRGGYGTTDLGQGIRRSKRGAGDYVIKNTKPHAHLSELGTQVRTTRKGAKRGRMPAKPVIAPEAVRTRARITRGVEDGAAQLKSDLLQVTR